MVIPYLLYSLWSRQVLFTMWARGSSFFEIEEGAHSHLTCAVSRNYSLWSGATTRSGVARCIKKCIKQAWSEDEMKIMEGWWWRGVEKRCKVRRVTSILDVRPRFACKIRLYNCIYTFWNAWPIRVHEHWCSCQNVWLLMVVAWWANGVGMAWDIDSYPTWECMTCGNVGVPSVTTGDNTWSANLC